MTRTRSNVAIAAFAILLSGCSTIPQQPVHDLVIRGGSIYDGSGGAAYLGDVAVDGDRITQVGTVTGTGTREVDATGMAVSPGFINMLSWATESLIEDGRGMSDIKQGVTLEVFGEGWSMGPFNDDLKRTNIAEQGDIKYPITWTTLGDYLEYLEGKGVSPNVASFVGATTVRMHELGEEDIDPTPEQLARMQGLVRAAMEEGALGVGSSLIYAPANYAETPELVALLKAAGTCGGMYISHMRSEGDNITQAIDELITIARDADVPAEIYHLKLAGKENWDRLPEVIAQIEAARAEGLRITTDMYLYTAGGTGLDATMPPWVKSGGYEAMVERLKDPAVRARVLNEMRAPGGDWENLILLAGGAENVQFIGFSEPALKPLTGKTLAEVAAERGTTPEDTAIDLVMQDGGIGAAFFLMSEDNVRKQTALPYMSFGSDAEAPATEGVFLLSDHHPRAYGNFARLLGKYVREEQALPLSDAIRKLTSLPAGNLGIRDRGMLASGKFADIVVFDPATIGDHATYAQPNQYATGVRDVFVNGVQVLSGGEHTGATPGQVVRGPGWTGWPDGGACTAG
ncbi:N-acyl-D-amino-acid deacylase family protein [Croceicoccus naphthovorans]|uniref:Aminoacylase n=1 Tax=Croceicoccus naphthovorans TaxID=1348774 RepID=A0A0G3XH68_9SPHN|nr:D-aminoacylase [Croceicoccus naphthovorans]AKM10890.1 aminoacylase [Croceicoccus naphthovorans]MBB3989125.1 N-acyl-D-amino-acid deacylase [Croceicoccus naphthovorans]